MPFFIYSACLHYVTLKISAWFNPRQVILVTVSYFLDLAYIPCLFSHKLEMKFIVYVHTCPRHGEEFRPYIHVLLHELV